MSRPAERFRLVPGLALATLSGTMMFVATATWDVWPLAWALFCPLFYAIRHASPKMAFLYGWTAGLVTNLGGFYWIPHLLVRFGHLSRPLSIFLFVLLALYQGLHFGVFAYLLRKTRSRLPRLPLTLAAPVFFITMELVTPFIFDWYIAISQAWVLPVIQVADLAGPLGVSFLLVLSSAALYELGEWLWLRLRAQPAARQPFPVKSVAPAALIIVAGLVYGFARIDQIGAERSVAPKVKVGLVQANIGISEKGSPRLRVKHHQIHLRESWELQREGAGLIVWPESSYPFWIDRAQTHDFPQGDLRRLMQRIEVPLLFGAGSYGGGEAYPYNSAFMMAPDGEILGRFDKNFLLMFGEYIPFYERIPSFKKWFPAASHFSHGTEVTTFPFRGHRIGPMICYEDIIPAFGLRLAKLQPNLLVNVTNDAWFGRTAEPYQHMALAVFRTIELRLDMVRAVNTGTSSFIDATGRVLAQTASHDPATEPGLQPERLLSEVALMPARATVFTTVGNLFGYLNLAAALALLGFALFRGHRG